MRREGQLGTQLQDPQAQRVRGTGAGAGSRHRDGAGGGAGLTIALDHVAAGVADIAKELWTEQGLKQAAGIHAPGPGPGVWPHPAPKGSSCHLPGPPGRPRPPGPEGWSESPPPQETQVEVLPPPPPWCPEGRGLGGFSGPGRREGACRRSPREPRTPHAISLSPHDRPGHRAHFPNGDTEVTGAAQVPRHSAHRPVAQPPLSTHHGGSQGRRLPHTLSGQPALTGSPQHRIPLPCLKLHLVVVGLTVGQALLLIMPVPQERLLTLGADEVLGRGARGRDGRVGAGATSPGDGSDPRRQPRG